MTSYTFECSVADLNGWLKNEWTVEEAGGFTIVVVPAKDQKEADGTLPTSPLEVKPIRVTEDAFVVDALATAKTEVKRAREAKK